MNLDNEMTVHVEPEEIMASVRKVIRDRRVTAVELEIAVFEPTESNFSGMRKIKTYVGSATRNTSEDSYDYEAGVLLALSRALAKAAKDLDNEGWQRVVRNDKLKKDKERKKIRRKERLARMMQEPSVLEEKAEEKN